MSPITVQRLSMDSSWWLSMGGVRLLVDPWLVGPEVDYFRWFNTQWHATPPVPPDAVPEWDAVLITQKYPDHLHPQTLTALNPQQVWATEPCVPALKRILPQAEVRVLSASEPTLRHGGLTVHRLPTRNRIDPIYEAVVLDDGAHSLWFAPHSLDLDAEHRAQLTDVSPCAALISSFRAYRLPSLLGGTVSPGLAGLKPLVEAAEPTWIIPTHDEPKTGTGLVPWLARITPFAPEQADALPWLKGRFRPLDDYAAHDLLGSPG